MTGKIKHSLCDILPSFHRRNETFYLWHFLVFLKWKNNPQSPTGYYSPCTRGNPLLILFFFFFFFSFWFHKITKLNLSILRLIWNQTDFHSVLNQSENSNYILTSVVSTGIKRMCDEQTLDLTRLNVSFDVGLYVFSQHLDKW